jgi:4-amino-4-deoxy-L-arabinose transferase-like glycosyltransferase
MQRVRPSQDRRGAVSAVSSGAAAPGAPRVGARHGLGERSTTLTVPTLATLFVVFLAFLRFMQWRIGALQADFGGHPDEPAHYVTGLMVHDYIGGHLFAPPLRFALDYYIHYPNVGLGNWPPLFYVGESLWMFAFGTSRAAVLAFVAVAAALLAVAIARVAARELGIVPAVASAGLFLVLPTVREQFSLVGPDVLVSLLMFVAATTYGRYLQLPSVRNAIRFGVLASLAILTKGNGVALALVPAIALLLHRRWDLLRRASFWVPALVVLVMAGPWQVLTFRVSQSAFAGETGWAFFSTAIPFFLRAIEQDFGWPILLLALAGAVHVMRRPDVRESRWVPIISLAVAVLLFHSVVPASMESRYMLSAFPSIVLLAGAGAVVVARQLPARWPLLARQTLVAGAAAAAFAAVTDYTPVRSYGAGAVARAVVADTVMRNPVVLVSSENQREGAVVAELAARDRGGLERYVMRGGKVLARMDWLGRNYSALFTEEAALQAFLDSIPVGLVVLDTSPGIHDYSHHDLLRRTITNRPAEWQLIGTFAPSSSAPGAGPLQLYRHLGVGGGRVNRIHMMVKGYDVSG